jgi:poly(3-hydroxybutyrate) depolymerase
MTQVERPIPSFEYWRDVNGCVGSEPALAVTRTEGMCETYTECDDGIEVTLCSVVGDDFVGTPLEHLAGHMPYANDDFDIAAEGGLERLCRYVAAAARVRATRGAPEWKARAATRDALAGRHHSHPDGAQ